MQSLKNEKIRKTKVVVLTRTPLGPGSPSGPAGPCDKEKTEVKATIFFTVHNIRVISQQTRETNKMPAYI